MAQHLYSRDVGSVGDVNRLFGEDKGLLVCRPGRGMAPYFIVPDGAFALVTQFGKDLDYAPGRPLWPAGFHWGSPWTKVANVVTKQSVVYNMPIKGCKTQDNVTVQINLAVVFRLLGDDTQGEDPFLVRNFVYKVTPRGLEQQLKDACEEATRTVSRAMAHTDVYGLRTELGDSGGQNAGAAALAARKTGKGGKVAAPAAASVEHVQLVAGRLPEDEGQQELEGDAALRQVGGPSDEQRAIEAVSKGQNVAAEMRETLNRQFNPQGVEVSDVIITDVQLPQQIVDQMAKKTQVISQNAAQKMTQEYEMLTLKQSEEERRS